MTHQKRNWIPAFAGMTVLLAAGAWWWLTREPAAPPPEAQPPALARLTRGVNLSTWLQHGVTRAEYAPVAADWKRIRALGLAHARIPVDPAALPDDAALAALRAAIEAAQSEDLLVVLAVQLPPERKQALFAGESGRAALAAAWRRLAGALRDLPPAHLAFEPLNEPETEDAAASRALLGHLARELRTVAPRHTLVVSGHRYAGVAELEALRPLDDPNVVYSFHFYEPHNFTHQGADWGDPAWKALRDFPYPSSPEAVAPLLDAAAPAARELLRWHGEERWDRAKVGALVERAARWGRAHRVPVWCSEFGVLKARAPAAGRAAWLRDVREALEANGIGWTHWDYAGGFGLDAAAIEALGLGVIPRSEATRDHLRDPSLRSG
jgi:endoglucanase